ncbi:MAG: transposase [Thermodesulfobacteriota bacterium]
MPRISRGLIDQSVYHIINRGNGGRAVFQKNGDYEAFVSILQEAKVRYLVKVFGYCLMPNHFHMVLMPDRAEYLSKMMQWLMTSHVRRHHKHYGTSGHIWQGRYKSFLIQMDNHLITILRYVEGNPVRAGLVNSANDWPWCSHPEATGKKPRVLIDEIPIELPKDWANYVDEPITEKELDKLRQSLNRQSPYGDSSWQVQMCRELGLESTLRPRGRPRGTDG